MVRLRIICDHDPSPRATMCMEAYTCIDSREDPGSQSAWKGRGGGGGGGRISLQLWHVCTHTGRQGYWKEVWGEIRAMAHRCDPCPACTAWWCPKALEDNSRKHQSQAVTATACEQTPPGGSTPDTIRAVNTCAQCTCAAACSIIVDYLQSFGIVMWRARPGHCPYANGLEAQVSRSNESAPR